MRTSASILAAALALQVSMTARAASPSAPASAVALPPGVSDDLTAIDGTAALAWASAQNDRTAKVLESDPSYAGFYADALAVGQSQDRLPKPSFLGGDIWNFWQDAQHPRGIWRRTTLSSYRMAYPGWVTRLDIDALAKKEKTDWVFQGADCLKPQDRYCLVGLSQGGEDAQTLREFDTHMGLFVRNGFILPRSKQSTAWVDRDTLLVGRDWGGTGATLTNSGYPFVIKRIGHTQSLDQAIEIARGEKTDVAVEPISLSDGSGNRLLLVRRSPTFFTNRFAVVDGMDSALAGTNPGTLRWLELPERIELQGMLHSRLVFTINEDWTPPGATRIPAGSLIAVDPKDSAHGVETVFTPNASQALDEIAVTRDTVIATYFENVRGRVSTFSMPAAVGGHWDRHPVALPDMATIHIADTDQASNSAFLTVEGYIAPPQLWLVNSATNSAEKIKEVPPQFDANGLSVDQLWARSTDGTRIPYFLVHPKAMKTDGSNPTLLTAYGGFQASYTPTYAPEIGRLWMTRGGVYAVANIRGGGEFGPAWHEAGRKTHRQIIYDDFASVGRDLVKRGITSVAHMGIRGRSNGGLLMGVEFTQHPELWNAVVIGVPLLDMLNYETMSAGASWADEYGSMAVPEERKFLESISPLQNLKAGVHYPEPFIFTSTRDDRVGPVHARRFAARLNALGVPFLYYEDTEGGHSGTVNAKEVAHERALEAVYLTQHLMQKGSH